MQSLKKKKKQHGSIQQAEEALDVNYEDVDFDIVGKTISSDLFKTLLAGRVKKNPKEDIHVDQFKQSKYESYTKTLSRLELQTMEDRRLHLCHQFAQKVS